MNIKYHALLYVHKRLSFYSVAKYVSKWVHNDTHTYTAIYYTIPNYKSTLKYARTKFCIFTSNIHLISKPVIFFFLWGQSMSLCNMVSKGPIVHAQDKWTQSTGKVKNLWETLAKWKAGGKHEAVKEKLVAMKLFPPYIPHTTLVMNPRLCDEKQID